MSYVQGTVLVVKTQTNDPATGLPMDPADVKIKVVPPTLPSYLLSFLGGGVAKLSTGVYQFSVLTAPEPGIWKYEVTASGAVAVVKQRHIRVTPKL